MLKIIQKSWVTHVCVSVLCQIKPRRCHSHGSGNLRLQIPDTFGEERQVLPDPPKNMARFVRTDSASFVAKKCSAHERERKRFQG